MLQMYPTWSNLFVLRLCPKKMFVLLQFGGLSDLKSYNSMSNNILKTEAAQTKL